MAKFYLGLFCVLSAVVFASAGAGYGFDQRAGYGGDFYGYPRYQYQYGVNSPTGDIKTASETRDGNAVKGHYRMLEADGSVRTVHYIADHTGFHANVQRTPNGRGYANTNLY